LDINPELTGDDNYCSMEAALGSACAIIREIVGVTLNVLLSLRKIVERKKVKSSFTTQMSSQQVVSASYRYGEIPFKKTNNFPKDI
jgi:hypothetical protein